MNSVVMSIRGLPSLELWVPTLPVVPVSSGWDQMVLGGSSGSSASAKHLFWNSSYRADSILQHDSSAVSQVDNWLQLDSTSPGTHSPTLSHSNSATVVTVHISY